eukprot:818375-Amphidinium_carterae.1
MTLTRADPSLAVYIASLQRKAAAPTVDDWYRLQRVVAYAKDNPKDIVYRKLQSPVHLAVFADAAFQKIDGEQSGLGMRGA